MSHYLLLFLSIGFLYYRRKYNHYMNLEDTDVSNENIEKHCNPHPLS